MKTNYTVMTRVVRVFKRIEKVWVSGKGQDAKFREIDKGWYVAFEGSYEALHFGYEDPGFKESDRVKITFEKV